MTDSALISFVLEASGFELEVLGESSLQILLEKRKKCAGVSDDQAYLQILKRNPEEWLHLLEELVVPETWFFRDQETFNFFIKVARQFIATNPQSTLRIFSAPCASGEEPYSIAMALLEEGFSETSFVIEAIDISSRQIEKARLAHYSEAIPRGCSPAMIAKYFIRNGNRLELNERVRNLVHFSQGSLVGEFKAAAMMPFHIVFCKNLLIYLSNKSRSALLSNLRHILVADGVLFAGHSEIPFLCRNGFNMHGPAGAFACQLQQEKKEARSEDRTIKIMPPAKYRTGKIEAISDSIAKLPPEKLEIPQLDKLKDLQLLADKGMFDDALVLGETILRETPVPRAYFLVGLIKQALNNFSAAEEMFHRALYLDDSFSEAVVALGLLYEKQGNIDKSQVFRDRARRLTGNKEKRV